MVTGANKQEYLDSLFKSEDTSHYHLSIETGDSFLCCAVHDEKTGKLLTIETEKPAYMDQNFHSVSCAILNLYFSLIPVDVFEPSECENYLKLNSSIPSNVNYHYRLIPALNAYSVFAVDRDFEIKLERKYPSVILKHATSFHLEQILSKSEIEKTMVWVNVFTGIFELIIVENGKLRFCNLFEYKVHEDISYYIHFALEQLNLPISNSEFKLIGPNLSQAMVDYLAKFFPVQFPDSIQSFKDKSVRFYTLTHQQACV